MRPKELGEFPEYFPDLQYQHMEEGRNRPFPAHGVEKTQAGEGNSQDDGAHEQRPPLALSQVVLQGLQDNSEPPLQTGHSK